MRLLLGIGIAIGIAIGTGSACGQTKSAAPLPKDDLIAELRSKELLFPVPGVDFSTLINTFSEARGKDRMHRALDILAPRGTPVLSADSGQLIKIHRSKLGGLSVYAADPTKHYIYFYAHLDKYFEGIKEGMVLRRGDTLGYVGTTGNAPPNTPHLHFAILKSKNIKKWSKGTPLDPYRVFLK